MDMEISVIHAVEKEHMKFLKNVVMDIQALICIVLLTTMITAVVQAIHIALMERRMYMIKTCLIRIVFEYF